MVILAILTAGLLAAAEPAPAPPTAPAGVEEFRFEEYNCAVSVPSDPAWTKARRGPEELDRPLLIVDDAPLECHFSLVVGAFSFTPSTTTRRMAVFFESEFLYATHAESLSSGWVVIQGLPAFEIRGKTQSPDGKELILAARCLCADDVNYLLICSRIGSADPLADADLRAMMDSFRFLRTPKVLIRSDPKPMLIYGGIGAVVTIAVVVLLLRLRRSRTRRLRTRPRPPPSPTPAA